MESTSKKHFSDFIQSINSNDKTQKNIVEELLRQETNNLFRYLTNEEINGFYIFIQHFFEKKEELFESMNKYITPFGLNEKITKLITEIVKKLYQKNKIEKDEFFKLYILGHINIKKLFKLLNEKYNSKFKEYENGNRDYFINEMELYLKKLNKKMKNKNKIKKEQEGKGENDIHEDNSIKNIEENISNINEEDLKERKIENKSKDENENLKKGNLEDKENNEKKNIKEKDLDNNINEKKNLEIKYKDEKESRTRTKEEYISNNEYLLEIENIGLKKELSKEINKKKNLKKKYETEISEQNKAIEELKIKEGNLNEVVEKLKKNLEYLKNENNEKDKKLIEYEKNIIDLKEKNTENEKKIGNNIINISELKEKNKENEKNIEDLNEKISNLTSQIISQKQIIDILIKDNEYLKKQVDKLKEMYEESIYSYDIGKKNKD